MTQNNMKRGIYGGLCVVFSASVCAQTMPNASTQSSPDGSSIPDISPTPYETRTTSIEPPSSARRFSMPSNPFAPASSPTEPISAPTPEPVPTMEPMPEPPPPASEECDASLSWSAPYSRENGDNLELWEIGGYEIHYYKDHIENGVNIIDVNDSYQMDHTISGLREGFYYFSIGTYDIDGLKSDLSEVVTLHCEPE
ncbi:MAG: hypothetical protein ACRBDL_01285 [Alphaproteobacteria bacterium]